MFEAYNCRTCGFADLYTRDIDEIPIGTELIELDTDSPYRCFRAADRGFS